MRIAICSSSFNREGGGIAAYTQDVSKILGNAGHDIMVISTEDNIPKYWQFDEKLQIRSLGIRIPSNKDQQIESAKILFKHIVSFDPEVLISSDHIWVTSLFPCFADARIKIAISHFLDGPIALSAACRPHETDWIITVSKAGRKWLIDNTDTTQEQVRVIYNTISDRRESYLKMNISGDKTLRIVYPGGGKEQKGADIVLEIIGYLANTDIRWKLLWLGPINFIKHFIPKKYMKHIDLIGSVSRNESVRYINESDFLLLPSRGEGCPISLLEAMKAGTIPIVSNCPSAMKEIIVHGVNGFIFSINKPKMVAEYLKQCITSTDLMKSIMQEAKNKFDEELAPSYWLKRMTDLMTTKRGDRYKNSDVDKFDSSLLIPWHRPAITWKKPSLQYIIERSQLMKHALRCAIKSLKIRKGL